MGAGRGASLAGPRCPVWLALRGGAGCHGGTHLPPWLPGEVLAGGRVPAPAGAWGEGAVREMYGGRGTHPAPQPHAQAPKWNPKGLPHQLSPSLGAASRWHCWVLGLGETWTATPRLVPWASGDTGGPRGQPPAQPPLPRVAAGQLWGWRRVGVPAKRCSAPPSWWPLCGAGSRHQSKHLVTSGSAPAGGEDAPRGPGRTLLPHPGARQRVDTAAVPAALAGALGSPTSQSKVQLPSSTPLPARRRAQPCRAPRAGLGSFCGRASPAINTS